MKLLTVECSRFSELSLPNSVCRTSPNVAHDKGESLLFQGYVHGECMV